jgi:hypothetical protein
MTVIDVVVHRKEELFQNPIAVRQMEWVLTTSGVLTT